MIVRDERAVHIVPGAVVGPHGVTTDSSLDGLRAYSSGTRSRSSPPTSSRGPAAAAVALTLVCVALMLLQSIVTDPTALDEAQSSALQSNAQGSTSPPTLDYPFAVPASLYPTPSQVNSTGTAKLVQLVSLSSSISSFGLLNASGPASGANQLWYSVGSYTPLAAEAILKELPCVSGNRTQGTCVTTPTVPILWSSPALVTSDSSAITADSLVAQGTDL